MSTSRPRSFTIEDALSIKSFADRCPIRFSPDGRLLAYSLEHFRAEEGKAEETWVVEVDSGEAQQILPEAHAAWGPSWAPTGQRLAFYADVGDGLQLWVWDAGTNETRRVSPAIISADCRFEVPQWMPDGKALICRLANAERLAHFDPSGRTIRKKQIEQPPAGDVTVRVWTSEPHVGPDSPMEVSGWDGRMHGTLARVEVATGEAIPLATDVQTGGWAVSPDGKYVAFTRLAGVPVGTQTVVFDLCIVPIAGGQVQVLAPKTVMRYGIAFSWSPDSAMIAYWNNGEVCVVSLDGEPRVLTQFGLGDIDELYSRPLWSPDQSFLFESAKATLWRIPVKGGGPVDLLADRSAAHVRDELVAAGDSSQLWSPDGGLSVIVPVAGGDGCGWARVNLDRGEFTQVMLRHCRIGDVVRFQADIHPRRALIAFLSEDATRPPDIWLTDMALSEPRHATHINSQLEDVEFSQPQILHWPDQHSGPHRLLLYPPPTRFGPPPYPAVVTIYEGRRSGLSAIFGVEGQHCENIHTYTHRGFAVCVPDLPLSKEAPAQSVRDLLTQAVKAMVDAGLADPQRMGIIGHSYGGYMVNCAITGLDCFAAAVSDTGMSDLVSVYGVASPHGDSGFIGWLETGQGKLGAPPWAAVEKYVQNSPIFQLDRVTTPVLIIHGDRDGAYWQAWELFSGLRRLGKVAELVVYHDEDHWQGEWRRANIIDRWQRVLAWFDKYLKPERPAND